MTSHEIEGRPAASEVATATPEDMIPLVNAASVLWHIMQSQPLFKIKIPGFLTSFEDGRALIRHTENPTRYTGVIIYQKEADVWSLTAVEVNPSTDAEGLGVAAIRRRQTHVLVAGESGSLTSEFGKIGNDGQFVPDNGLRDSEDQTIRPLTPIECSDYTHQLSHLLTNSSTE